jgi:hypothetical protein
LLPLETLIKPNGHKAYILFSHVVQVILSERVVLMQYSALAPSTNQSFISIDLATDLV